MSFILNVEKACDQGFRVTVKNIPETGLKVQCAKSMFGFWDKFVTPEEPTITFDEQDGLIGGAVTYIQVLTLDNYILDKTENITAPSTGCKSISLNGWNGCKWYTLLTGPSEVLLNKSFQIKAILKEIPLKLPGADYEIEFYEGSLEGTLIWTTITDENSTALCNVPAKVTLGTYKYFAKYRDASTYCEPKTGLSVNVKETLEPEGIWEQIIQFIMDTFNITDEKQAEMIAYAGIGLGALLLISMLGK